KRSATSGGISDGAINATHASYSADFSPCSISVGIVGNALIRFEDAIPNIRTRPDCAKGAVALKLGNAASTSPDTNAVIIASFDRYGTCKNFVLVSSRKSS